MNNLKGDLNNLVTTENISILNAMTLIDKNTKKMLIVVDESKKIIGTITDGDIRRAILKGLLVSTPIKEVYNRNYSCVNDSVGTNEIKRIFIEKKINLIPIVNENRVLINYIEIDDLINFDILEKENFVLIMAGGMGTRLKPLTDNIPKPMLKVGKKPILQIIIEQFFNYGFRNFIISVNYKADIIESYFRDGSDFNVNIKYVREKERLGTAGAIALAENYLDKPFFVMNGDVLTNVNFYNLLQFHLDNKNDMTIGSRIYETEIPYGVININQSNVTSLLEKPIVSYMVNGGIYVLNPSLVKEIPKGDYFDITQLINIMLNNNNKIGSFPITDYWMDIGKIEDYYKANEDIKLLNKRLIY